MSLSVYCGSENIVSGTELRLNCSRGVQLRNPEHNLEYSSTLSVQFPAGEPFQTVSVGLLVLADLENKKDATSSPVSITVTNPWNEETKEIFLHFVPVIYSTFSLLTAMSKKFLQVTVLSPSSGNYVLKNGRMEIINVQQISGLKLTPINQKYPEIVISKQFEGSFLWELDIGEVRNDETPAKVKFTLDYVPEDRSEPERSFSAIYQFQDYRTLYTIHAKVEPAKGKTSISLILNLYLDWKFQNM